MVLTTTPPAPPTLRTRTAPTLRRVRTTPGLLLAVTAGLVVLGLLWVAMANSGTRAREDQVRDVRTVSGPLSVHALDIYRSLSDADASAATAFLAGGDGTPALRQRYQDDIARAGSALAQALRATNEPDRRSEEKLRSLAIGLPVYTGLVETARSYDRQQLPLGAAYLREASGLMRGTLLPAAQDLFTRETDRLAASQRAGADFPVSVPVLGLLLLGALAAAQVFLLRRTNRVLNPGLAVATAVTVVGLVWSTVAIGSAVGYLDDGRKLGSEQFIRLAEARVLVLQARADESLTLISRGDGAADERHYVQVLTRLVGADGRSGLLGDAADRASSDRDLFDRVAGLTRYWWGLHKKVRALDDRGDYRGAVALVSGPGETTSVAFERLDQRLAEYVELTGDYFDDRADGAAGDLASARVAIVALGLLAVVAVVLGTRKRIGEYR
ncbi:hypothetical protein [Cryptosporangium phraense]|uniref:Secreted protein n=1 Tax=Cryptosporangium phraense TaxID=2593070 RepID=A0A545AH56_9ACTN|nr:hypothetical protein [Cryptosporangium phraense]TQS40647.1 hypothetical protein FL583_33520 [Cryptosporangium phraense]